MSASNQRFEIQMRMQRYVKILEETKANKETTDWRNSKHASKKTFGREKHVDTNIDAENQRLSSRLCGILTEDRKSKTSEFVPGWRIGTGGIVIDCYTTNRNDPVKFGFVQKMRKERVKQFKKRDERNAYLRNKINSVKSNYAVADLKEEYEENRRRGRAIFGRMSNTRLHLGLLDAAINNKLAPKSPSRSPSPTNTRPCSPSAVLSSKTSNLRVVEGLHNRSSSPVSPLPPYCMQSMNIGRLSTKGSDIFDDKPGWDNSPLVTSQMGDTIATAKLYGSVGELKPLPIDHSVNIVKKSIDRIRNKQRGLTSPITNRPVSAPVRANGLSSSAFSRLDNNPLGSMRFDEVSGIQRPASSTQSRHGFNQSNLQSAQEGVFASPTIAVAMPQLDKPIFSMNQGTKSSEIVPEVAIETLPKTLRETRPDLFPPRALMLMEDRIDVRVQRVIGSEAIVKPASGVNTLRGKEETVPYVVRIADVGVKSQAKYLQPSVTTEDNPDDIVATSTGIMIEVVLAEEEDKLVSESEHDDQVLPPCSLEHFVSMKQLRRLAYRCGLNKLAVLLRSMRSRDKSAGLYECIADNIDENSEQELCDMLMRCIDVVHIEHCVPSYGDKPPEVLKRQPMIVLVVDDS